MRLLFRLLFPIFILLLAALLRFYRLDAQSFWNDEGNSARIAERSIDLIIAGAAGDIHPPGYYLLLAAWRAVAGQSEFALRGLSVFAGIILVAIVYRLGKRYFNPPAAWCAALLAALHPALIYYSQEARMYELAAMEAGVVFLVISHWRLEIGDWRLEIRRFTWKTRIAFSLLLAAGLYTHYSFGFVIVAVNTFFFIQLAWLTFTKFQPSSSAPSSGTSQGRFSISNLLSLISNLLLPQLVALLLFSPWLAVAIRHLTTWPASAASAASAAQLPFVTALLGVSNWLVLGSTTNPVLPLAWASALVAFIFLFLRWRSRTAPLFIWLVVPPSLMLAFGLYSQTFAKFLIIAAPPLCLLVAGGLVTLFYSTPRLLMKMAVMLSLGLWLIAAGIGINDIYFNPSYARADYRSIARYIDSIAQSRDAILLNAPNQWEVFTYYHPDLSNVFPVATSRPLNAPEQIAALEKITLEHDRLFVVYWGEAQSDPGRVIESWLNEHTFKAYDQWYGDVRLATYAAPRAAAALQTRTDVTFGDRIVLEGYSLNARTFSPGDILQLTLFWRSDSPIAKRYKVFVHLVSDPQLPPAAQHDGEPGGGLALTSTWQPGQTVADNHGVYLPLDLPPGEYTLSVGLYSVEDDTRLTHPGGDALFLSTVTVR